MNNSDEQQIKIYKAKLESLRQVFIGLRMQFYCTNPEKKFKICDNYFGYLNLETIKLTLGRLYILLADDFKSKNNKHNTISFKILIQDILDNLPNCPNKNLKKLLSCINDIDEKYKCFRDKVYAHIDLDSNGKLKDISEFSISPNDINSLIILAEDIYNELFLLLSNSSSDHMQYHIQSLSHKLWDAYEQAGLVKKI